MIMSFNKSIGIVRIGEREIGKIVIFLTEFIV